MCDKIKISKLKEFTGYKLVITNEKGEYFSPYTGIQYKVGPVPKFIESQKNNDYAVNCLFYSKLQEKYQLTGVLKELDTKFYDNIDGLISNYELPTKCKRSIIKMKLTGDIYSGDFLGHNDIMLGNYIESIELINENI
jgi:hypothetical protein